MGTPLRVFSFILVAGLCDTHLANVQQQKLAGEEEKYMFREFRLDNKYAENVTNVLT